MGNQSTISSGFIIASSLAGAGKTTVMLALARILTQKKQKVQTFKCGHDYQYATLLEKAGNCPCRNLDTWLMGNDGVLNNFLNATTNCDIALIEGTMGLFDGVPNSGFNSNELADGSTAAIASLLKLPVILVLNAAHITHTFAALVKGLSEFHPDVRIVGVIANHIIEPEQADFIRKLLDRKGLPPLIGWLKHNSLWSFAENEKRLFDPQQMEKLIQSLSSDLLKTLDENEFLHAITLNSNYQLGESTGLNPNEKVPSKVRLGIAKDQAFSFYYENNLEFLRAAGIELVEFSPLHDTSLPPNIMGLYIGGGNPENYIEQLSKNKQLCNEIKLFSEANFPIYAEGGGVMYLSQCIEVDRIHYSMCNVLPIETKLSKQQESQNYRLVKTNIETFLGPQGTSFRGYEMHHSVIEKKSTQGVAVCKIANPRGLAQEYKEEGLWINNTYASYIHIHFASNPQIATNFANFLCKTKSKINEQNIQLNNLNDEDDENFFPEPQSERPHPTSLVPIIAYAADGEGGWDEFDFPPNTQCIKIGTNENLCDIILDEEEGISEVQIIVRRFRDFWILVECGSESKTIINGFCKRQAIIPPHGTLLLQIGEAEFVLTCPPDPSIIEQKKNIPSGEIVKNGEFMIRSTGLKLSFKFSQSVLIGRNPACIIPCEGEPFAAILFEWHNQLFVSYIGKKTLRIGKEIGHKATLITALETRIRAGADTFAVKLPSSYRPCMKMPPMPQNPPHWILVEITPEVCLGTHFHLPLQANESFIIGRDSDINLSLTENGISRKHAELKISEDQKSIILTDLNSSNGTYLNGSQIEKPEHCIAGDIIGIGEKLLILLYQN